MKMRVESKSHFHLPQGFSGDICKSDLNQKYQALNAKQDCWTILKG